MPAPERPKAGKGRWTIVYPDTTRAQRVERKALAKFTRTYQHMLTTQTEMAEGSGHRPPGPYFYTQNGKTYASLPLEMIQGIRQCPHYEQMLKDTKAEGVHIPEMILAQDPKTHILTPQEYLQKGRTGDDAADQEPQHYERNGGEGRQCRRDQIPSNGIHKLSAAREAGHSSATVKEVSTKSIQTESCDTIYVSRDTLIAYTIAIVQNTQTLQFEQM